MTADGKRGRVGAVRLLVPQQKIEIAVALLQQGVVHGGRRWSAME
jgi:hypothetical protein